MRSKARRHVTPRDVIQDGNIRYLLPVANDMQAECVFDDSRLEHFLATLRKYGRARATLDIVIKSNDQLAVEFSGRYAIHE